MGPRVLVTTAALLLVAGLACASVPTESARLVAGAAAAVQVSDPATIQSVRWSELEGGGEEVRIESDGVLVWTQYRDDLGNLIVELPNTILSEQVTGLESDGLVTGVEIEAFPAAERPLTRFIVRTLAATEHSLTLDGTALSLQFVPRTVTAESQIAPVAGEPAPAGTPENPLPGPAPRGVVATRLEGVEIDDSTIRIFGDGEFSYSTFTLQDPPRFVIDLAGVVNTADRSLVDADTRFVDQVRMAQFRPYPEPVSRVVLDLRESGLPVLEQSVDGLVVRFDGSAGAQVAAADTTAADDPIPAQESVAAGELVAEEEPAVVEAPLVESAPEALAELEPVPEEPGPEEMGPEETLAEARAEEIAAEEPAPERIAEAVAPGPEVEEPAFEELDLDEPVAEEAAIAPTEVESAELESAPERELVEEPLVVATGDPAPEAVVAAETEAPLRIRDDSSREVPWQPEEPSEVTLYEAQQVTIDASGTQTSGAPTPFGVREIGEQTRWVGEPISMSLKDSDVTEVLRSIARLADLNIVIQPGVSGPVTVELDRVPWDQALDQILKVNNLGQQLEGNILRIAPVEQLAREARQQQELEQAKALSVPLATIMRRISYAEAADVARILTRGQRTQTSGLGSQGLAFIQTGILSQRGSVSVDERTNTLIIRELPSYLNSVIQIIENLDVPEKQVMIEARIVETTRNFSRSLGIDWRFNGVANAARGNTTGLTFPNNVDAEGGVALVTGASNGFLNLGLGNVLNTFQLDVALNAAESDGLVNVISAPKVAVLNNEQASIQSGLQIPVQTVANNTVTVQFVNATLRLDVTPHVTAEGTIMMNINIQKREPQLAFAIVGASNAPIATREAQTRVIVRDGGTAVIGGIYEVSSNDGSDKVPGLANIPVLGHLFKNRNRSNQNEELLIFITPRVIQL